jgi:hypothetical protein
MMLYLWDVLILLPVLTLFLLYYDASGFADASLSYLMKSSENRIDLFLTAGFRFDSNKLSGALSGTKYFLVIIVIAFNQI